MTCTSWPFLSLSLCLSTYRCPCRMFRLYFCRFLSSCLSLFFRYIFCWFFYSVFCWVNRFNQPFKAARCSATMADDLLIIHFRRKRVFSIVYSLHTSSYYRPTGSTGILLSLTHISVELSTQFYKKKYVNFTDARPIIFAYCSCTVFIHSFIPEFM